MFSRARSALALATIACACGPELPVSERIASTRMLALRADVSAPLPLLPPEDPEAAPRCQAQPFETVTLTPFLVDPEGVVDPRDVDPLWIACELGPGQGLFACLRGAMPTSLDALPACATPSLAELDPAAPLPEFASPCLIPQGVADPGLREFTVPLAPGLLVGGDIELTFIGHGPGEADTKQCATALLAGETDLPNTCIQAVQRLSVGPVEQLLELADELGVALPPEIDALPRPDEIPDGDRNTRVTSFSVTRVRDDVREELGEIARGEVIDGQRGDVLEITTESPASDLQTYHVAINGGLDGFKEEVEDYEGDWFRSWGILQTNDSDDPVSTNEWTLARGEQDEGELPPDGRATLFYVIRDDRRGVDWWWIHADVAAP